MRGDGPARDMANGPSSSSAVEQRFATDGAVVGLVAVEQLVRGGEQLLPIVRHSPSRVRIFIISAACRITQRYVPVAARLARSRPALQRGHLYWFRLRHRRYLRLAH